MYYFKMDGINLWSFPATGVPNDNEIWGRWSKNIISDDTGAVYIPAITEKKELSKKELLIAQKDKGISVVGIKYMKKKKLI